MPCFDSRDSSETLHRESQERLDRLANIACTFAQAVEKLTGVHNTTQDSMMAFMATTGIPEERINEAIQWWKQHQAEDARRVHEAKYCMNIRLHRGGLDESMQTAEKIEPTLEAIRDYFTRRQVFGYDELSRIVVEEYSNRPDGRIGWPCTYLVLLNDKPVAMTSCDLKVPA